MASGGSELTSAKSASWHRLELVKGRDVGHPKMKSYDHSCVALDAYDQNRHTRISWNERAKILQLAAVTSLLGAPKVAGKEVPAQAIARRSLNMLDRPAPSARQPQSDRSC